MRKFFVTAFVLSAVLALATSGFALQRVSQPATDVARADGWTAQGTCSVAYYNICTGWIWLFGFNLGASFGICVDSCCGPTDNTSLVTSWQYFTTPGAIGYGFTGLSEVYAADPDCCPTGAPIGSQPLLPLSGWNGIAWGVSVPSTFILTFGTAVVPNYAPAATDHPAAGPTGPAACGTCYPTTRVNHSYIYTYGPYSFCPGSTFFDGVCDAQLFWDVELACDVSVEESSWGSIKNLYR
jgi:hypothetical protein